jgi:ABC-type transport system involved in multi-copper enzyme maturation permease subunit
VTNLLRAELFRLLRRRMTWILAALTAGLSLLIYITLWIAVEGSSAADADAEMIDDLNRTLLVESIPAFADDIVWQLVAIMGVILMASSVGSEFSWRTVLTLTTWTGDRIRLLLAKLSVALGLTVLGVILGFIVCLGASVAIGAIRGTLDGQLSGALVGDVALSGVLTWIALLPYVLLAGALTMLGRSTALGLSVALAVLFLEGLATTLIDLLGDSWAWLKNFTINWNVNGVLAENGYVPGMSSAPDPDLPPTWQAMLVLLAFSLGFVAATLAIFQRRDITE